mgnify:CR=1 FL=1
MLRDIADTLETLAAQTLLVRQLQDRSVTREYWAVALGVPRPTGTVDAPIGRDARNHLGCYAAPWKRFSHAQQAACARD